MLSTEIKAGLVGPTLDDDVAFRLKYQGLRELLLDAVKANREDGE